MSEKCTEVITSTTQRKIGRLKKEGERRKKERTKTLRKKERKEGMHLLHFTICYQNSFSVRRQDTDSRTILT
jgi:hypothetical protein